VATLNIIVVGAISSFLLLLFQQAQRLQSLEDFRKGKAAYLVATDVAARGLDILGVEGVVNFDCPRAISSYVHRVGRTARAGAKGLAVTLVEDSERKILKEVRKTC